MSYGTPKYKVAYYLKSPAGDKWFLLALLYIPICAFYANIQTVKQRDYCRIERMVLHVKLIIEIVNRRVMRMSLMMEKRLPPR